MELRLSTLNTPKCDPKTSEELLCGHLGLENKPRSVRCPQPMDVNTLCMQHFLGFQLHKQHRARVLPFI